MEVELPINSKKMNAHEALQLCIENCQLEIDNILQLIKDASLKGECSLTINHNVKGGVTFYLRQLGFTVEIEIINITPSTNFYNSIISWGI